MASFAKCLLVTVPTRSWPKISRKSGGDKRILLVNGDYPLRLGEDSPWRGENQGNLAAGGTGVGKGSTERDRWICEQIAPTQKARGLLFVGIDVIE